MRNFGYSPMYYHSSFWPEGFIVLVINIAFWVAIVWLIGALLRHFGSSSGTHCCGRSCGHNAEKEDDVSPSHNAYMHIIKQRYAKGDIDKKQYEELKHDLIEAEEGKEKE